MYICFTSLILKKCFLTDEAYINWFLFRVFIKVTSFFCNLKFTFYLLLYNLGLPFSSTRTSTIPLLSSLPTAYITLVELSYTISQPKVLSYLTYVKSSCFKLSMEFIIIIVIKIITKNTPKLQPKSHPTVSSVCPYYPYNHLKFVYAFINTRNISKKYKMSKKTIKHQFFFESIYLFTLIWQPIRYIPITVNITAIIIVAINDKVIMY